MAAKKTGGKPRASLPEAELGRMIRRLQTNYRYRAHINRYRYGPYFVNSGCWHTDAQIMAAFGISKAELNACVKAFHESGHHGRRWDHKRVERAVFAFINREKRWPTHADMRNWRVTELPCWSTISYHSSFEDLVVKYCRTHRKMCTPAFVFSIRNLTTRRRVVEMIGIEKLIAGGELMQQDDFGKLWKLPKDSVDPFALYVEVVNKSPRLNDRGKIVRNKEGDPVYDHYFLRVPHVMRSAKDAVAWTLNIQAAEFAGFAAES